MISIRAHLLLWMLSALSLGAVLLVLASYAFTLEEMNEVFDDELKQVALTVLRHHQANADSIPFAPAANGHNGHEEELAVITQVWTADGKRVFVSAPLAEIPFTRDQGLQTLQTRDGKWRVYTARSVANVIQTAQPLAARRALAAEIGLRLLIPALIMVPLLALLLIIALRRGLLPLAEAANEVERKSASSLDPIPDASLPLELRPLVAAINTLMARLAGALSVQRQFTADAAHELRTPLAALRLQLQLLEQATSHAARAEATADITRGLDRATHLVEQLLSLSRLEPGATEQQLQPMDLAELARSVVGDFSARAEEKKIDLGAVTGAVANIYGDKHQLRIMLNNLVDNALRYTPAGGQVDVSVYCDKLTQDAIVEVRDSGSGIAPEERARVFDRFYRGSAQQTKELVPGTGLGLAIVKKIAERHHATIELADGLPNSSRQTGLTVRIRFNIAKAVVV